MTEAMAGETVSGKAVSLMQIGSITILTVETDDGRMVELPGDWRMMQMAFEGRKPGCRITIKNYGTEDATMYFDEAPSSLED